MDKYYIINHHLHGGIAISSELKLFLLEGGRTPFRVREIMKLMSYRKLRNTHKAQEDKKVTRVASWITPWCSISNSQFLQKKRELVQCSWAGSSRCVSFMSHHSCCAFSWCCPWIIHVPVKNSLQEFSSSSMPSSSISCTCV